MLNAEAKLFRLLTLKRKLFLKTWPSEKQAALEVSLSEDLKSTGSFVRSGARNGSKNLLKRLVTGNLRKLPKGISEGCNRTSLFSNLEDLQLCSEDSSCQENPPKRHRSRLCPQSVSLSKIGIIGHCADLSMIQSDEARTFLFRLGPLYVQNQSDSRQFSTRPSWQKHSSSRRVRR